MEELIEANFITVFNTHTPEKHIPYKDCPRVNKMFPVTYKVDPWC